MHLKHRGDMDQLSAVSLEWIFTRHSNHKKKIQVLCSEYDNGKLILFFFFPQLKSASSSSDEKNKSLFKFNSKPTVQSTITQTVVYL